ncbi:LecA/PA-IL family lectin [Enterobacter mori]|uniref:LecA/PA-IL family lectin n=1 Tax=Enterobacter mori TaxID=539813 RepID=UPI0030760828
MSTKSAWSGEINSTLEQGANTGLQVNKGDKITIIATGLIKYGKEDYAWAYPGGNIGKNGQKKDIAILKARFSESGKSYDIGTGVYKLSAPESGELRLFISDSSHSDNSGAFHADVYLGENEELATNEPVQWKGHIPATSSEWVKTGITIRKGDKILLVASGQAQYDSRGRTFGPDGDSKHPSAQTPDASFVLPGAIAGALLIKTGDHIHSIGSGGKPWEAPTEGEISFIFNDTNKASEYANNTGGYDVNLIVTR